MGRGGGWVRRALCLADCAFCRHSSPYPRRPRKRDARENALAGCQGKRTWRCQTKVARPRSFHAGGEAGRSGLPGGAAPVLRGRVIPGREQAGREVDVGRRDLAEPEEGEEPLAVEHPEEGDGALPAEPGAELAVDMAEDQVDGLLRDAGDGDALREDRAEILVSVLDMRLLPGVERGAVEDARPRPVGEPAPLHGRGVGELGSVVRQEDGEEEAEGLRPERLLQPVERLYHRERGAGVADEGGHERAGVQVHGEQHPPLARPQDAVDLDDGGVRVRGDERLAVVEAAPVPAVRVDLVVDGLPRPWLHARGAGHVGPVHPGQEAAGDVAVQRPEADGEGVRTAGHDVREGLAEAEAAQDGLADGVELQPVQVGAPPRRGEQAAVLPVGRGAVMPHLRKAAFRPRRAAVAHVGGAVQPSALHRLGEVRGAGAADGLPRGGGRGPPVLLRRIAAAAVAFRGEQAQRAVPRAVPAGLPLAVPEDLAGDGRVGYMQHLRDPGQRPSGRQHLRDPPALVLGQVFLVHGFIFP